MELNKELLNKYDDLKAILASYGSVAVAFSGGVDSAFLMHAAHEALGGRALALTASSRSFPERELNEAVSFCRERGIRQVSIESEELSAEGFAQNPKNRCYICKKQLFTKFLKAAGKEGMKEVAEGSNLDDNGDYRPGLMAVAELGIRSPLRESGFTKEEIRSCSKEIGLPTWDKPSFACLASRVPYGEQITQKKLEMVERAEDVLSEIGLTQYRVRVHHGGADGGYDETREHETEQSLHEKITRILAEHEQATKNMIARIEVLPEEFELVMRQENREKIVKKVKEAGFSYVSLDLEGYKMGSMNRVLPK